METTITKKGVLHKADVPTYKDDSKIYGNKAKARGLIREQKDLEDDLVDQKQLVQFMARGFAGLWASLPQDIKDANPYKANFDAFSNLIVNSNFRLDLESDQATKIASIIQDEITFAQIVQDEYLSKKA